MGCSGIALGRSRIVIVVQLAPAADVPATVLGVA